jgi:ABC-type transporter Mla subunit MlaD
MDQRDRQIEQVTRQIEQITLQVAQLTGPVRQLTRHSVTLTDALVSLTHHVERHDEQIGALIQQGKDTDARLNALITIVERRESGHQ